MNRKKSWITSAHRGFVNGAFRENSLAACYNAYLNGADMIETDARLTSDGVLVVNHDAVAKGFNDKGEPVSYEVATTPAEVICSIILSEDEKWGVQRIPTLEQVLNVAYHMGTYVNIDLKNGYRIAEPAARTVLKCGMAGKAVYGLNRSGMDGIKAILAIDPDARFIDFGVQFANAVKDFDERGKRCFCFTGNTKAENIQAIRDGGCLLALTGIDESNFRASIECHPDMCEFLHTSDFRKIEDEYFESVKLY